jgi:hypothetical protein
MQTEHLDEGDPATMQSCLLYSVLIVSETKARSPDERSPSIHNLGMVSIMLCACGTPI